MPKKSKKSKSRRQTLKQKYKVIKKVKEHHRKKRKEARKNGTLHKEPKDPGIPNAWPFKEELIQQMQEQKERAKLREKYMRAKQRSDAEMGVADEMEQLQNHAQEQAVEYERERREMEPGSHGYVDYSMRAFFKDFAKVVEASDVIIEVLDARDPMGTRCRDVEKFVRRQGPNKKVILLLNKIDLVPKEVVEAWLKYLREELPTVAFKCSTQKQTSNLGRNSSTTDATSHGSECLGADILVQLLKNYARGRGGLKTSVTVGIVGLPNVGKSSLINSLKRTKVAKVGNAPGVTKSVQEVHLDRQVTLLDSPGVVFSEVGEDGKAAAALRNCVKVDQLEDPALPVTEILKRCPKKQLMTLYRIPDYKDADTFLINVATVRGKLKKGGTIDATAAAKIVLQDWNDGKIPYYTSPPRRQSEVQGSAAVVADWGSEFDPSAFANEQATIIDNISSLQQKMDRKSFFETETAGEVHMQMEASEDELEIMDEEETEPPSNSRKTKSQNQKLYDNEGQFNPRSAKQTKKRAKRGRVAQNEDMKMDDDDDDDSDFDFTRDFPESRNAFAQLEESE